MEIRDKVILVTGGARRLGKAIALHLADEGAQVIIHYHQSGAEARATVEEIERMGGSAFPISCDIGQPEAVKKMAGEIGSRYGRLDVLVHGASPFVSTPFPADNISEWVSVMNTMVNGSFYLFNDMAPLFQRTETGCIITLLDRSALEPWRNYGAHSVGKTALLALTRQLAVELAPKIRVNALLPGPVLAPEDYDEIHKMRLAERTLLRHWGSPADVTRAVKYLIEADYVTGEVLMVNGGEHLGR